MRNMAEDYTKLQRLTHSTRKTTLRGKVLEETNDFKGLGIFVSADSNIDAYTPTSGNPLLSATRSN